MNRRDLEPVLAIDTGGSLAAAALSLNIAPSAVTKRLAALEAQLGQRLFHRTTRRVSATPEGQTLCDRAHALLAGFTALEAELQERKTEPIGLIRLAARLGSGACGWGQRLPRFNNATHRLRCSCSSPSSCPTWAATGLTVLSGCGRYAARRHRNGCRGAWRATSACWWRHRRI